MRLISCLSCGVLLSVLACSGDKGGAEGTTAGPGAGGQTSTTAKSSRKCQPSADPAWLEEGQSVSAQIRCATGTASTANAFEVADLPQGATFDAATATLHWTPTLSQAGVYTIAVTHTESGETGSVKVGVADAFDQSGNQPIVDPKTYTEEYGLPVMHLTVPDSINANAVDPETDKTAWNAATIVYRGHVYAAEAKYRGSSSLKYPKKNYALRFPDEDQFSEDLIEGAVTSRRHLQLVTTFDDPSQVRYRLALELWNRMDPNNVRVRQFGLVLFVNGKYAGVYGATDKISASLFGHFGYSDLGNLYMGIDHNANFAKFRYNEPKPQVETAAKSSLFEGYEKKDGTPEQGQTGAFDDLTALVDFVVNSTDSDFDSQLAKKLDLENYYNWFIHTTAIQAFDTFGKNSLHYHDPAANTPWRVVLWDFNECFGQRWQTARFEQSLKVADIVYQSSGGFGYTNRNYLWRRIWDHPTLSTQLKSRYASLLRGTLSKDAVLGLFDQMVEEVAACAKRDDRRWQTEYKDYFRNNRNDDFLDSAAEAAYVRSFIERRWTDLLGQFP